MILSNLFTEIRPQSPNDVPVIALIVPVALSLCLGVFIADQFETYFTITIWAVLTAGSLTTAALIVLLRHSPPSLILVISAVGVGGLRMADQREILEDDISIVAMPALTNDHENSRKLVRLVGSVEREPLREPAPPKSANNPFPEAKTRLRIAVHYLVGTSGERTKASGHAAVSLTGEGPSVHRGDVIELLGWLTLPNSPSSPGEWDMSVRYRRQGVRVLVYSESPYAVRLIDGRGQWSFAAFFERVAGFCRTRLADRLSAGSLGIAEACILGSYTHLPREELEPFVHSGTLHLLVVSGWHIAVVAWAVWMIAKWLFAPLRWRALAALAAVWSYTLLTGCEAPAVRAAAFASLVLAGKLAARSIDPIHGIAAALAVVILVDPTQLFGAGAQLSFAAVLGLVHFGNLFASRREELFDQDELWWKRKLRDFGNAMFASTAAWAATAPLVAHHFNLFSPGSIWLSVLLAPIVAASIAAGFAVIVLPAMLFGPFAWLTESSIWLVQSIVAWSEHVPFGFAYLPGPSIFWTLGVYALLFGPSFVGGNHWVRPAGRRHACLILLWSTLGLCVWSRVPAPDGPEFHQLAVGHGNCAVVRAGGRVVLLDAGSLTMPHAAERIIAPWLWMHGIGRIDAVVVSHADSDHFNAISPLAERFPIGAVFAPPQFARLEQSGVASLYTDLVRRGLRVSFIWKDDRLSLGSMALDVLWPPANATLQSDNAASAVILASAKGGVVLATGDLSEDGLAAFMETPLLHPEIMIVPHHGAKSSNTIEFAEWAKSTAVISSQHVRSGDTLSNYRICGAADFRTDSEGSIAVRWRADGMTVESHRTHRRLEIPAAIEGTRPRR